MLQSALSITRPGRLGRHLPAIGSVVLQALVLPTLAPVRRAMERERVHRQLQELGPHLLRDVGIEPLGRGYHTRRADGD